MTAPRNRTSSKGRGAKKKATKKAKKGASAKPTNGKGTAAADAADEGSDTGPIENEIKIEALKYKLKALQLEWEREDARVRAEIAPKLNDLLARAQRNDPGWKKATEIRRAAVNEAIDKLTDKLPDGYAIVNVKLGEGTYRAVHDPEGRGKHVE